MKVFLCQDVTNIGIKGEIIKVSDGFARNYLFPKRLAVEINAQNEATFKKRSINVDQRKKVIESEKSMLAEKISHITITIKRKMHDDGKLYAAISAGEIVSALQDQGVSISKGQVKLEKSIKEKGTFAVPIKLTARLKAELTVRVVPE